MGCGCGGGANSNKKRVGSGRNVRSINQTRNVINNSASPVRTVGLDGMTVERRRIDGLRRKAIRDALNK